MKTDALLSGVAATACGVAAFTAFASRDPLTGSIWTLSTCVWVFSALLYSRDRYR